MTEGLFQNCVYVMTCVRLQFFDIWYNSIKNKWEFYIVSSIEIYKLQTKELF